MKTNVVKDTQNRINSLLNEKQSQLDDIKQKQMDAAEKIMETSERIKVSAEKMNLDEYEKARLDKIKYQTALDMYRDRQEQLHNMQFVTEEESDQVIDSLLEYEKELETKFKHDIEVPLKKIVESLKKYQNDVIETENTIKAWEQSIHPNFRQEGYTKTLPDGTLTDRHEKPWPVHPVPYLGCEAALTLENFFRQNNLL